MLHTEEEVLKGKWRFNHKFTGWLLIIIRHAAGFRMLSQQVHSSCVNIIINPTVLKIPHGYTLKHVPSNQSLIHLILYHQGRWDIF